MNRRVVLPLVAAGALILLLGASAEAGLFHRTCAPACCEPAVSAPAACAPACAPSCEPSCKVKKVRCFKPRCFEPCAPACCEPAKAAPAPCAPTCEPSYKVRCRRICRHRAACCEAPGCDGGAAAPAVPAAPAPTPAKS